MWTYLKKRYAILRMTAYVNGELSPEAKRFISRQIDTHPDCYAEYVRQREAQRELKRHLPALGRPNDNQLNMMWENIQAQMQPRTAAQRTSRPLDWRYGLAVGISVIVLLLSFALNGRSVQADFTPEFPRPVLQTLSQQATPSYHTPAVQPTVIALVIITEPGYPAQLQNTPAPETPGR